MVGLLGVELSEPSTCRQAFLRRAVGVIPDAADLGYLAGVCEDAARRLPRNEETSTKTPKAGLYEVSPDHNAILRALPRLPRFVLANGFSGHGRQHAPAVGKAISEVIADGESRTLDISAFSVARFARGQVAPEGNVI